MNTLHLAIIEPLLGNGFQRTSGRDPITLGPGCGVGHTTAAGYGGFGSGHNGTYGKTYGLVLTPIHPGSPSGDYQGGHPGGGLIRIHAAGKVEIAGRLDASARESDTSESSASGGGIWVTAGGRMTVLPGAVLKARGGYRCTGAGGPGGGGDRSGELLRRRDRPHALFCPGGRAPGLCL